MTWLVGGITVCRSVSLSHTHLFHVNVSKQACFSYFLIPLFFSRLLDFSHFFPDCHFASLNMSISLYVQQYRCVYGVVCVYVSKRLALGPCSSSVQFNVVWSVWKVKWTQRFSKTGQGYFRADRVTKALSVPAQKFSTERQQTPRLCLSAAPVCDQWKVSRNLSPFTLGLFWLVIVSTFLFLFVFWRKLTGL